MAIIKKSDLVLEFKINNIYKDDEKYDWVWIDFKLEINFNNKPICIENHNKKKSIIGWEDQSPVIFFEFLENILSSQKTEKFYYEDIAMESVQFECITYPTDEFELIIWYDLYNIDNDNKIWYEEPDYCLGQNFIGLKLSLNRNEIIHIYKSLKNQYKIILKQLGWNSVINAEKRCFFENGRYSNFEIKHKSKAKGLKIENIRKVAFEKNKPYYKIALGVTCSEKGKHKGTYFLYIDNDIEKEEAEKLLDLKNWDDYVLKLKL
jgi:hypothetical protein